MKKTISYLLVGVSAMAMLALGSCSKSNSSLPPINGYNSSNDVAKSNLKAYWTFDNTKAEAVSSVSPTTDIKSSYVTGVIGQALKLDSGYLTYPALTGIGTDSLALSSFTVSLWVKDIVNNQKAGTEIIALTQSVAKQTDWNVGPVNVGIETGWRASTNDTITLHPSFNTYISGAPSHQDNVTNGSFSDLGKTWLAVVNQGNPWIHYVCVYDQSTGVFVIYSDGVIVSNTKYQSRFSTATPVISRLPLSAVIGSFPNVGAGYTHSANQSWQGLMKGTVDEIRVFNKALTATEVGSLYALGQAGR
jgi:hypothetical protein